MTCAQHGEHLRHEDLDEADIVSRSGDAELIAADVDVGVGEGGLDDAQQLVSRAEQRHHRLGRRNGDGGLRGGTHVVEILPSAGRPAERTTAQHVDVGMTHRLAALEAGVGHEAMTGSRDPLLPRHLGSEGEQL